MTVVIVQLKLLKILCHQMHKALLVVTVKCHQNHHVLVIIFHAERMVWCMKRPFKMAR